MMSKWCRISEASTVFWSSLPRSKEWRNQFFGISHLTRAGFFFSPKYNKDVYREITLKCWNEKNIIISSSLGGIPGPLTVEVVKVFFGGPGPKNEQIIISLERGWWKFPPKSSSSYILVHHHENSSIHVPQPSIHQAGGGFSARKFPQAAHRDST